MKNKSDQTLFIYKTLHSINEICSYKNPLRNLRISNDQKLLTRLDKSVRRNAGIRVGTRVLLLPFVSDKYPHKYDDKTIPTYPIEPIMPLSFVDRFKSQFATGRAYVIDVTSTIAQDNKIPDTTIRIKLYFPILHFSIASSRSKTGLTTPRSTIDDEMF